MPSFKSKLLIFALRHRHLLQGKLKRRDHVDWSTSVQELRADVEKGSGGLLGKLPEHLKVTPVDINGIYAEWIRAENAKTDRVILYFHGGGLVMGSAKSHRGIVAKFVDGSNINALVFDYALAPENPFPAALNDSLTVYQYLLDSGIRADKIILMGDSGGGNLCYTTPLALKKKNLPLPAGIISLSAWTDLKNTSPSYKENAELDNLCFKDAQVVFAKYYAGDQDAGNPLISPVYGDLSGFPPMLLYAGEHELLRDDSVRLAENAVKAGVDATLHIGKGLFHCYPACAPLFPEANEALKEICAFIQKHINKTM